MERLHILADAPGDNWWKQLLQEWRPSGQHSDKGEGLRVAIREKTIDFYRDGWRVAHVGFGQARTDELPQVNMSTHIKFLDPASQKRTFVKFVASGDDAKLQYNGNALSIRQIINNIDARIRVIRAGKYKRKGLEKKGLDRIIGNNAAVIDLEMAMRLDKEIARNYSCGSEKVGAPRIDIVSLERSQSGANIVFWEAKTLDDPRLRAEEESKVEVIKQLKIYREYLANPKRCEAIKEAYQKTCRGLVELNDMRQNRAELDLLIVNVACGKIRLDVDLKPRLIIFGLKNGKPASEDKYWTPHAERIVSAGIWATYAENPADIDLTADAKPIAA